METLGGKHCYSHFGEDQIVSYLFGEKSDGFYVDVGCYHPTLFSNTYALYEKGWRGVLVDANPFMIEKCRQLRNEDVCLNMAIGDRDGTAEFYKFGDWGSSNTLDPSFRDFILGEQDVEVTETLIVEISTLGRLFREHTLGREIDFLNIDIENLDVKALESNDWSNFRPKVIAAEDLHFNIAAPDQSKIHGLLLSQGYTIAARMIMSSIYIDRKAAEQLNTRGIILNTSVD